MWEYTQLRTSHQLQHLLEAMFVDSRIPADVRELDGPIGPRTSAMDINLDEWNSSSHLKPYI